MEKLGKEEIQLKILFGIALVALAVVILPLFRISHYNFRSVDDFEYAESAEMVWEDSHSVLKVLAKQVSYTYDYYYAWQGTFFSEWWSTSMMAIFSKNAYYMGTYLSLGGFVLAELFAFMVIFRKLLEADFYRSAIASITCLCVQILYTPVPSEAFFWFCSAMLYTFIQALAFVLLAVIVLQYFANERRSVIILEIFALILTFAVAGSNYVTALTMLLVYAFVVLWVIYKKHAVKKLFIWNALMYLIFFLVNVLAPGNTNRQIASGVDHLSAVQAIWISLKEAVIYVTTNTILPYMIVGILLVPLFVNIVKRKDYKYPFPLLVSIFSFGVFAAQFTPSIYALGIIGAGRILNIYRWSFLLLLFGNELYWIGWLMRVRRERHGIVEEQSKESGFRSYILPGWMIGGVLLLISFWPWGWKTLTTVSAFESLYKGEAKAYYNEHLERLLILEDESVKEACLEPFSCAPYVLFFGDIKEDPDDWVNKSVADYYGKEVVRLKKEQ